MQNILVNGIVLSMDKYGRARLFIDTSSEIYKLIDALSNTQPHNYVKFPFEGKEINYPEMVLIITLKKNHKKFWMNKIEQARGKKIQVELSPRLWSMGANSGISLDLIDIVE